MPWLEMRPMDQKVLFIADWLRQIACLSDLCERYGISRKTGYKWIRRYHQGGVEALEERSRKPLHSPEQTPYRIRKAIIEFRTRGRSVMGPKKIQTLLQERFPDEAVPSRTTIYKVLHAEGLVSKRRRKRRVAPFAQPFKAVLAPNDLWSADFKGQFKMQNGQWCYPLTVMDHQSRYLLCCHAMTGTRFEETQQTFRRIFQHYGLPRRIRTDNGVPFATTAIGGLSRLAIWWITLGILPERIESGKPQQNGRHERMHRTLKQEAIRPAAASLSSQQRLFDQFQQSYNHERPHEALQQKRPASCYQCSIRPYTDTPQEPTYPDYFVVRRVQGTGIVNCRGKIVYVSHLLKGHPVGLNEVDAGQWEVYFGPVKLGRFDERYAKGNSVPYLTLKSVTHVP
jgi:putative transposase